MTTVNYDRRASRRWVSRRSGGAGGCRTAGSWAHAHRVENADVAVLRRSVRGDPNGLPPDAFLIKNVCKNTAGGFWGEPHRGSR
jgi:hypothetical protein